MGDDGRRSVDQATRFVGKTSIPCVAKTPLGAGRIAGLGKAVSRTRVM